MTDSLKGTSIIGFARGSDHNATLHGVNPATGDALEPSYSPASPDELAQALSLAGSAATPFSETTPTSRAAFLSAIASEIENSIEELAARGPLETGLPEARIRGEAGRTCGQLRMFAGLIEEGSWVHARIDHAIADREPIPKPDLRCMLRPLGPVAVFCASNFPLAFSTAGGDTASALAAGCPVIVKAHRSHPGMAEIAGRCIQKAAQDNGMPEGTFSLLYGSQDLGQALVESPVIQAVGFTGSQAGGTALMKIAAARPQPIPVYAEMSSINPVIILPAALAEKGEELAEGLFGSLMLGAGQFCTNPGLVFLPENGTEAFLQKITELVSAGTGATMLNAHTASAYQERARELKESTGVITLALAIGEGAPAVFMANQETFSNDLSLQDECFGPATLIVTGSPENLPSVLARLEGQLTGTIHATEAELSENTALIQSLQNRVGRLIFNGFPTGVEVCPSMIHGGPYPATSDGRSTSVGTLAIERFTRPISWQDFPDAALPAELQEANPLGIKRIVNNTHTS
ncbi:MAG: aldehyde dehydrogenase (NADP(+)) [Akkermansiaceae bacterium]